MRFKGTILLTILLILLGFYLYYVEIPGEKKKAEERIKEAKLFSFTLNEISRLNIRNAKGEVELEYFPDHPSTPWRIYLPVETVANKYTADDLAILLEGLKASRLVEEKPSHLKDFGLDPPSYRVLITINTFDTLIVEVGDENLTGSDVYVRKGMGTSLYLVPAGIKEILNKDLRAWRQREVFPSAPEDIHKIRITSSRGTIDLIRRSEGWSIMSNPSKKEGGTALGARGDRSEIANLLGSIVNLRGDGLIDFRKDKFKQGFGPPIMKINLKISEVEREASFFKDQTKPDIVYVVTAPLDPIFQIPESAFRVMDQPFKTYRDKHVVPLDFPDQIEGLKIERPEGSFFLKKRDGSWQVGEKTAKEVKEQDTVSRLLIEIYNLRLAVFRDDVKNNSTEAGLENPQMTIHLLGKEGKALGQIDFGRMTGDLVFGKSSGQPHPFMLKKAVLDQIPRGKDF